MSETKAILQAISEVRTDLRDFRKEIINKADLHEQHDIDRFETVNQKISALSHAKSYEDGRKSFWNKTPVLIFGSGGVVGLIQYLITHYAS